MRVLKLVTVYPPSNCATLVTFDEGPVNNCKEYSRMIMSSHDVIGPAVAVPWSWIHCES